MGDVIMNCPCCQSIMYSKSPIRDNVYMDLHCHNQECPSKELNYTPHIEVVLSQTKAPWRVRSYHLAFKEKAGYRDMDTWYILEGTPTETSLHIRYSYKMTEKIIFDEDNSITSGFITKKDNAQIWENDLVISIDKFIPIRSGTEMHKDAQKVFENLKSIDIYTDYGYDYSNNNYYKNWNPNSTKSAADSARVFSGYYGDFDY